MHGRYGLLSQPLPHAGSSWGPGMGHKTVEAPCSSTCTRPGRVPAVSQFLSSPDATSLFSPVCQHQAVSRGKPVLVDVCTVLTVTVPPVGVIAMWVAWKGDSCMTLGTLKPGVKACSLGSIGCIRLAGVPGSCAALTKYRRHGDLRLRRAVISPSVGQKSKWVSLGWNQSVMGLAPPEGCRETIPWPRPATGGAHLPGLMAASCVLKAGVWHLPVSLRFCLLL